MSFFNEINDVNSKHIFTMSAIDILTSSYYCMTVRAMIAECRTDRTNDPLFCQTSCNSMTVTDVRNVSRYIVKLR